MSFSNWQGYCFQGETIFLQKTMLGDGKLSKYNKQIIIKHFPVEIVVQQVFEVCAWY